MMEKEKKRKVSPAKQRIIDNYEMQRRKYLEEGYEEKQEIISVFYSTVYGKRDAFPAQSCKYFKCRR